MPLVARSFPAWARLPNQPATYPRLFVAVAGERAILPGQVLQLAGLPATLLDDPAGRVSLVQTWQILDALLRLTGDPSFGFESGQRVPLTAHGNLGIALMCAPSGREAIRILQRYWHLRGRGVVLDLREEGGVISLGLSPELPMPPHLLFFLMSSMLVSMYRGICLVIGESTFRMELWLPGEEPAGFDRWRDQLPPVRFGMPGAQLRVHADNTLLDRPLLTSNPEGLIQALALCERESVVLGGAVDPVLQVTRNALQLSGNGYPTPEMIAATQHLTPRTYRRRLQDSGSGYTSLLEEARRRDSLRLLANPALEIRAISVMLGYADPANFTRAFRQWTGMSPREWRRINVA